MKRTKRTAVLVILCFTWAVGAASALEVVAPAETVLGDAVTLYLPAGQEITSASVELLTEGGTVMGASRGFPYDTGGSAGSWVAIIGIPTTISSGQYRLRVTAVTPHGSVSEESPLTVASREFRHEDIRLDGALATLQTEDTALKTSQAQELWRILTTYNANAVYQSGPLIMPVANYRISSPFAERRLFVFAGGGDQHSIHQGVDLAVPGGTPIKAAGAGRVVFVGPMIMTGNTVVIEHLPGVFSLYFHMERADVTDGQVVSQGETIGQVGSTGLATGPHLHWQVEVAGVAVNPMSLLQTGLVNPAKLNIQSSAR